VIRFTIEIDTVPQGGNEYGVGVRIVGNVNPRGVPEGEGATLIGIGMAINAYMRSRGAPSFNCLKGLADV
jgi:hypothetical protein